MKLKKLTLLLAVCALFLVGCDKEDTNNDNIIGNDDNYVENGVDTGVGGKGGVMSNNNMSDGNSAGDNTPASSHATDDGGIIDESGNAIKDAADGIGDAAKDIGRGAGDAAKDVGKGIEDTMDNAR